MNWKLIFALSLIGLIMGFATVFWISARIELVFWAVIFIACAYIIARQCEEKHFFHGFMVSVVNSIWITAFHFIFYDTYINNHPEIQAMNADLPDGFNPKITMLATGPLVGAMAGLILGLFSFIASRFVHKTTPLV